MATGLTNKHVTSKSAHQFQDLFETIYAGPVTVDIANAATGSGTSGVGTATVSGALVGDLVLVMNYGAGALTAGVPVFGDISAASTLRLTAMNNSAGAKDYASAVWVVVILRPRWP